MIEAFCGTHHVGASSEWQYVLVSTKHQVATHTRSEVDDHVGVGRTNTINYFCVQFGVARAKTSAWVANVNVHNRGASLCRFDA